MPLLCKAGPLRARPQLACLVQGACAMAHRESRACAGSMIAVMGYLRTKELTVVAAPLPLQELAAQEGNCLARQTRTHHGANQALAQLSDEPRADVATASTQAALQQSEAGRGRYGGPRRRKAMHCPHKFRCSTPRWTEHMCSRPFWEVWHSTHSSPTGQAAGVRLRPALILLEQ